MSITMLGFAGVTALMLCMLLMPWTARLAKRWGALDEPNRRKVHHGAIPRLGGVAIGVSFMACCILYLPPSKDLLALLAGLGVILATGILDDVKHVSPKIKLLGQVIACLVFIVLSNNSIDSFGDFLGTGQIYSGWLAVPLTVFCMVGIINALNMSDGLDGLAGGLCLIACCFLAWFAIISSYWLNLYLLTILSGCLIGFLYFNFHPARIFMGDTGSMVLGYILAAICVLFQNVDDRFPVYPISLALVLGLPIHDTLFVIVKRIVRGKHPFAADASHLHHRLLSLGITHPGVVTLMYLLMVSYGLLAVFLHRQPEWMQFYIGVTYGVLLFSTVVILQRSGFSSPAWLSGRSGEDRFKRIFNTLSEWMVKTVPAMTWIIPVIFIIPLLFFPGIRAGTEWVSFITAFLVLILFPWKREELQLQWTHGLLYISMFVLLVVLNLFGPPWTPVYLHIMTVVILLWVVLKMLFKRHGDVILTSGFEVLMIFMSWAVPTLLTRAMSLPDDMYRMFLHSCLEAIPFLFAIKIIIRNSAKADRRLIISFVTTFLLIGLRQYLEPL